VGGGLSHHRLDWANPSLLRSSLFEGSIRPEDVARKAAKDTRMRLNCPACTQELTPTRDDLTTLEIDSCFYCHGLWFDYNELRRFFTAPKLYNKFRLPQHSFKVKIKGAPKERLCPRCDSVALKEVKLDGVIVDECGDCKGIWLDSGEVTRLIEIYNKGKLKGKSETARQIRKGHFDQGPIGQVSKTVALAFKMLF